MIIKWKRLEVNLFYDITTNQLDWRVMGCVVEMLICEFEAEVTVRVNIFDPIDPLRFKLKVGLLLSEPALPEACALICEPDVVPAKLKVTWALLLIA